MNSNNQLRCSGSRKRAFARSLTHVSRAAIAASILTSGIANADTAVYFNDDAAAGIQTFVDTIAAADANHNANNPGATQTSHIYEFDILNTSGSTFLVISGGGAPSVIVETTRGGSPAPNNGFGNQGSDGFTNWGNSHDGTFASAEAMGYTFKFFETDGTTPFSMNALGTLVNDWGTCCVVNNPTPSGGTANASEVYLRFGSTAPILLGGISSSIPGIEHFIGAINDSNFFNEVTVIATGRGEFFGVGGYLTFSSVALNSVPAGSSVVDGNGLGGPTPSIPDIDTGNTYYTANQLGAAQVNPNFVGGTLRFDMDTFVGANFTVQSQGGTIDSEENIVSVTGAFTGAGTMRKTGAGMLVLSGTNTNTGGFSVMDGILRAASDANLGGGPLTIGNATFQAGNTLTSSRSLIVEHAGSRFDVQGHDVIWQGDVSGQGVLNLLGSGRLELTGANTHTGGTHIQGGMLVASADENLGTGALTIGNAVFQAGADLSSEREMIVDHAGSRFDVQGHDVAWVGDVSGQGRLNVLGNGRLTLGGTNTYAGGTYVAGGTLAGDTGAIQGDIVNDGTVEFTQSAEGTYSGGMSGNGSLRKLGAGMLSLSGASSFSGGTEIVDGTLVASADENLGAGSLTIGNAVFRAGANLASEREMIVADAGSRIDLQDHTVAWLGNISGQGALNVLGNGRFVLAGLSAHTGGTHVAGGTLAGWTGSIHGGVVNDGIVEFMQAEDGAYAGEMSGSGDLIKLGAGMLELSGTNTYAGDTIIAGGTLRVSGENNLGDGDLIIGNAVFQAGADLSSERGMIVDHAGSRFDVQENAVTWSGDISGQGRLNMLGTGRLTLTGANAYEGGTYVAGGTLAGEAGAIQGDILNDGTVEFTQQSEGLYSGSISGTGSLRKLGLGLLELTGVSALTGESYLDQGALSINGLLGTNLLTVADGAALYGRGGIDGNVLVLSGGSLKPGNSPGTLYVSGDVSLSAGSIFETEIDGRVYSAAGGAGSYDRLVLTGEGATFTAAGSINPVLRGITGAANNDFDPVIGDRFTVVVADTIAGSFDTVAQPSAGLPANTRFRVVYNPGSIELALVARSLGLMAQESGLRTNAVAAAYGLDLATAYGEQAGGVLGSLFADLDSMGAAQVNAALTSLSGDFHAHILESTESVLIGSDAMILSAALGGKGVGGIDRELSNGVRVWSRAEASGASYDADRAATGFEEDVYGVTLGATFLNTPDLRAGIAGSYKTVELYNDTAAGATNQMLSAYAYGSYTVTPRLTLSGLAGYTQASPKTARTTVLASAIAQTRSKETVDIKHAQVEARYQLVDTGATRVYALGGLRTAILNVDAYREQGNVSHADLSLIGESRHTLQTKLGGEVARKLAGTELAVFGNWMRDIGDDPTVERTASLGNAFWQVQSVERSLDTYHYGFSARRGISERVGLELEYSGRYNDPNYDAQQLMLGINIAW
ncbi:MAG: autotransporter-associated beta strand repeat-containing protein [Hyphomonas sp.]